jgi:sugar/nucleoside kinase (ribokinase family)
MNTPRALFLGRTTLDALYWLERFPDEDTKGYASGFHVAPGGPALNAAITHALLGGKAMLISAVGGGPWAVPLRSELERHNIDLLDLAAGTAYEAPLSAVLVNGSNGSRTVVNPPLVEMPLSRFARGWEAELQPEWGETPRVLLTDGFFFNEVSTLMTSLRDAGTTLCLDGGSWKPGTPELASLLTVAICSERFRVPGQASDAEAIFAFFAAKCVPYIAVTRGGRSILGWDRGRRFEIEIAPIAAKDTLGAGDVLHGAFCYFFALEREFEAALRRAAEVATLSCQHVGTQAWAAQGR